MNVPVTPGVTIREIASFPPSVAEVATAIPAFVGHVRNATAPDGSTNIGVSKRITSLLEFEQIYGIPVAQTLAVAVTKREGRVDPSSRRRRARSPASRSSSAPSTSARRRAGFVTTHKNRQNPAPLPITCLYLT